MVIMFEFKFSMQLATAADGKHDIFFKPGQLRHFIQNVLFWK